MDCDGMGGLVRVLQALIIELRAWISHTNCQVLALYLLLHYGLWTVECQEGESRWCDRG